MSDRPNILLFVCDDLRFDALGCMGDSVVQTPNLDRLAAEGACFEQCHMPGGTSGAVCMPSRAMIHTGRSLFHIEREGQRMPDAHRTLGEHLKSVGYNTFHTGKWHNCRESLARSFDGGDEIFIGGMGDQWNMPLFHYDSSGKYDARLPRIQNPFHDKAVDHLAADHTSDGRHATEVFVDAATGFLESRDRAVPFFLSIALTAPHDPRSAPQKFHDLYDPGEIPLPANFTAQHPHNTGALPGVTSKGDRLIARDESLADMPRRPDEIREHIADYYAMISHLDHEFGRLRDALERSEQWGNTIVVFTADHGLAVGQHGLLGKQCIYDHSVRVPLIMAGPGIPKGKRPEAMVLHFDLFRSICELIDLEVPETVEGESLIQVWQGGDGREFLYLAYARTIRGLVESGYKLIEYAGPEGYRATQLFHLETDPKETFDLAHSPDHQSRIESMRERLIEISLTNGDRESEVGRVFWEWEEESLARRWTEDGGRCR
ncbi:MAG: choline-sulfatase [Verrucomicrobia bacterium]|nr:MAG: choline-sulfatase [Verrucomicrobiota bacterium]